MDAFVKVSRHKHKYSRCNRGQVDSHRSGPKRGSYIRWKAFPAFSGWICALSHLTLCSLRTKRTEGKESVSYRRKNGEETEERRRG